MMQANSNAVIAIGGSAKAESYRTLIDNNLAFDLLRLAFVALHCSRG